MLRRCDRDEAQADQWIPEKAGRHDRADHQIGLMLQQCILGPSEHGLQQLDAHRRSLGGEFHEGVEQQPGRKDDVDGQPQLRLPALGQRSGRRFERCGFLGQRPRTAIEQLPGGGKRRLAALNFEGFDSEQRLELLHCVGDSRLALVQACGGLRIAARLDDRNQGTPLVERNSRGSHQSPINRINLWIWPIIYAFLLVLVNR